MDYTKFRESGHLIPIELASKKDYIIDIANIEQSHTGRVDAWIANTFIVEACNLIKNAITLFELGYFDCAYYSLRQSIEVSMTMMYIIENQDQKSNNELEKWKSEEHFPMYQQMQKYLEANETVFKDIKEKLQLFFDHIDNTKKKINKFVHKQGFDKFYSSRNHSINHNYLDNDIFTNKFESYLKDCIGTVAIMRLSIDPFPILLNDEEIYYRTGDTVTSAYSDNFISKYIGEEHIKNYKNTELYIQHYVYFMDFEKQSEAINYVIKNQYIDTTKINEILRQEHLLNKKECSAIKSIQTCSKITKFYTINGLRMYFTNRTTKRTITSWQSCDFDDFQKSDAPMNQKYDEAFISVFHILDEAVFLEHNDILSDEDVILISSFFNVSE